MRRPLAGSWLLALALGATVMAPGASADPSDPNPPTRADVREARQAADAAENDVASVRAALASANADLDAAQIAAMQAAEAYNGALLRRKEARHDARVAERRSQRADRRLARQKDLYRETLLASYDAGVGLDGFDAILSADGIDGVLERTSAAGMIQDSLEEQHEQYVAASDRAERAQSRAERTADTADRAAEDARQARDDARAAADRAEATAASIAAEKDRLVARLAELQGVSVELAQQRQDAREERLREQQQAEQEEQQQEQQEQDDQATDPGQDDGGTGDGGDSSDTPPAGVPDDPGPGSTDPTPPADPAPPAPGGGAAAAVAFARAQLGDPYVWAAAGPDAWDCSGLTMGAWAAGGKSLPHYSVAQYEVSTPISSSQLRPGDLVFWGTSSSPSSIYHEALYVGDGMIIHAPRPGRSVEEVSMYYWIPPNLFARP